MNNKFVQIIVIYQNEILVLEEKTMNKNKITLPMGVIEPGESNLQAAIRNCYEGTGVIVTQKDLIADLNIYHLTNADIEFKIKPLVFQICDKQMPVLMDDKMARIFYMKLSHFKEKCKNSNEKKLIEESVKLLETRK